MAGAILAGLIIVSTSPFSFPHPDQGALFDAGFASGSQAGESELGQRLTDARQRAYLDGILEAAAMLQETQSPGDWLRDSIPRVNAAILSNGTAPDDFRQGYQDGLQAAQGAETVEAS
ncbi:MAG TPA: hypothetical protein QGF05_04835 [Dehalococcoidia bacterium]|nr:hypothetical protein [Dehalococcoidia bacterium]